MKMEKLYDEQEEIRGYHLGNYYLLKHYVWGNTYEWIITDEDRISIMSCEMTNLIEKKQSKIRGKF